MELSAELATLPNCSIDELDRVAANTDRSGFLPESPPMAVIKATSVDDVVATLTLASTRRIPVVTRGAGTGLAGGSSAHAGEIVLDLSRMRHVRIDPVEQIAIVEPGLLNAELNAAAGEFGLFYAPDPASTAICSIGGNVATNAGGMRCAKYGVTRDAVLALTVVLADGRILHTGTDTIKGVAGYDLKSLFVGSEGTLGVVVEATLRLRPLPPFTSTVAAFFPDARSAGGAASAVIASRVQPSMLEFVDGPTLEAIDEALGTTYRQRGAAMVLAQTDGYGALAERDVVLDALRPHAVHIDVAETQEEADALVQARREAIPSLERLGTVSIGDIGVPRGRLGEAIAGIEQISKDTGVRINTIAHASDGNLHPMIVVNDGSSIVSGAPKKALGAMFHLAAGLGGTLTGEHGVGLLKRDWLEEEVGSTALELQHSIKRVLDPHAILNPGKAI
ncbi:MAG TPA: FAD-linked oxidase C-terminal domain-containing protein [Microbacteriaceae bacterium]